MVHDDLVVVVLPMPRISKNLYQKSPLNGYLIIDDCVSYYIPYFTMGFQKAKDWRCASDVKQSDKLLRAAKQKIDDPHRHSPLPKWTFGFSKRRGPNICAFLAIAICK